MKLSQTAQPRGISRKKTDPAIHGERKRYAARSSAREPGPVGRTGRERAAATPASLSLLASHALAAELHRHRSFLFPSATPRLGGGLGLLLLDLVLELRPVERLPPRPDLVELLLGGCGHPVENRLRRRVAVDGQAPHDLDRIPVLLSGRREDEWPGVVEDREELLLDRVVLAIALLLGATVESGGSAVASAIWMRWPSVAMNSRSERVVGMRDCR